MKFNQNDPKYLIYLDIIGREIYAKHKYLSEWSTFRFLGQVYQETKHTLLVESNQKIKQYIKDHFIFRCYIQQSENLTKCVEFDGVKIYGTPEQRIKKIKKINRRKLH